MEPIRLREYDELVGVEGTDAGERAVGPADLHEIDPVGVAEAHSLPQVVLREIAAAAQYPARLADPAGVHGDHCAEAAEAGIHPASGSEFVWLSGKSLSIENLPVSKMKMARRHAAS